MNEAVKLELVGNDVEENRPPVVISVRQPWAFLIIYAGRDIENRDWSTKHRGRTLIHAAKNMTRDEYEWAVWFCNNIRARHPFPCHLPPMQSLQRGGIIGSVEIVDCVSKSQSPWFRGRYGFVLRDPQPLPFYPCRGQLGFFRI